VNESFAEERAHLRPLPLAPFRAVLRLERRISRDGMVSVGGNFYSVPDATHRRVVEVHTLANEVQIFEDGTLIAAHPVLEGRHQRRVAPGHRKAITNHRFSGAHADVVLGRNGDIVAQRSLEVYDAIARRLAQGGRV
jgi:exosome complex RNA-binding protein Rrp4